MAAAQPVGQRNDHMAEIFSLVDEMGPVQEGYVLMGTCQSDQVAISAGGESPRKYWPEAPPYFFYQALVSVLSLPRVWDRYISPGDGPYHYLMVPKLLICHLISCRGGLLTATYLNGKLP